MTSEMNVVLIQLIEGVVKGYHDCPFTIRTGGHCILNKKIGNRGEAFRVVTL